VGTKLVLFDCLTCDKCVPVCPNHANFTYALPATTLPVVKLTRGADGAWKKTTAAPLVIAKKHQLATYADFCNECGNCDVFCPEDGGPYVLKPRFFGTEQTWAREPKGDGFLVLKDGTARGRFNGREFQLQGTQFSGAGFDLEVTTPDEPKGRVDAGVEVDLTYLHILRWLRDSVLGATPNYVNA
jgi:putative selenate reductase